MRVSSAGWQGRLQSNHSARCYLSKFANTSVKLCEVRQPSEETSTLHHFTVVADIDHFQLEEDARDRRDSLLAHFIPKSLQSLQVGKVPRHGDCSDIPVSVIASIIGQHLLMSSSVRLSRQRVSNPLGVILV